MIKRLANEFLKYKSRDDIILGYLGSKRTESVTLHRYILSLQESDGFDENLGDYLSETVVDYMCKVNNIDRHKQGKKKDLYAIGSILLMGYQNCTIWGSGLPFQPSMLRSIPHSKLFRKLDIRCVRGPLTESWLRKMGHDCPCAYGDPALLMPLIYTPQKNECQNEFIFIPHYSTDVSAVSEDIKKVTVSMGTNDYRGVIDKICSSKFVISESLHGIILAEAYGVPAVIFNSPRKKVFV